MRNGMSLHPMYMPGTMQSLQIPNFGNGFGTGDCPIQLNNLSIGSFPVGEERQTAHGLPNQPSPSLQPLALPSALDIRKSTATSDLDVTHAHQAPFLLPTSAMVRTVDFSIIARWLNDSSLIINFLGLTWKQVIAGADTHRCPFSFKTNRYDSSLEHQSFGHLSIRLPGLWLHVCIVYKVAGWQSQLFLLSYLLADMETNCLEGCILGQTNLHLMGPNNTAQSEILIQQLDR